MIKIGNTVLQRIEVTGREDVNVVKRAGDENVLFWGGRANTYRPSINNDIIQQFGTTDKGARKNFSLCKTDTWSEGEALPASACRLTIKAPSGWSQEEATSLAFTVSFGTDFPSVTLILYKAAGSPEYMEVDVTLQNPIQPMKKLYVATGESMQLWAYFAINTGVEANEGRFYIKSSGGRDPGDSYNPRRITHYASPASLLTAANVTDTSPSLRFADYYNKFGASGVKPSVAIDIGACNTVSDYGAYLVQTDNVPSPRTIPLGKINQVYDNYPSF